ncbi:unnamed protein product [Symbiodinium sp. KB8]|nr:unnamed protein product [Symbiodinium sp. KB8]
MAIAVNVRLLSGKTVALQTEPGEEVRTLELRAQTALGVGQGTGRLVDSSGNILDVKPPVKRTKLENGDSLTLCILYQVQIAASAWAFAAIRGDGSVVTWGSSDAGGDSSAVNGELNNVQHIQASAGAFAAVRADGSVVTWGDAGRGGDSSLVQDQLKSVQQIQASCHAFAAILGDGSVVTWGRAQFGGDSSAVQDELKNVRQIQASSCAFAAIVDDGSVVAWGSAGHAGDSSAVRDQLKNVQQIQATRHAFAAILGDGSVVTWGNAGAGGDSSAVQDQLSNIRQIQASFTAFAAILADGSVVTWGFPDDGGDSSAVQDQLKNVQQIQATQSAFAAILGDGSVVTWGDAEFGGDSSAVQDQLKNVQQIQACQSTFAAILDDGSVVTWGGYGDSTAVQDKLKNVQQIQASCSAFAAILGDGSVVTWGTADHGGDSSAVEHELKKWAQQLMEESSAPPTAAQQPPTPSSSLPLSSAGALSRPKTETGPTEMNSVTVAQLKTLAEEVRLRGEADSVNMYRVNDILVKPACCTHKKPYARILNAEGLSVECFVTHAWKEELQKFVRSIELCFAHAPEKPSLWICIFAIIQSDNPLDLSEQLGNDPAHAPFTEALKRANRYLVVRNDAVDVFARIWCCWELYCAAQGGFLQSDKYIVTGPSRFPNPENWDIGKADASNLEDKRLIMLAVASNQEIYHTIIEKAVLIRNHHVPEEDQEKCGNPARWMARSLGGASHATAAILPPTLTRHASA